MSSIRITGLATGIDTDQMIKDLMKVERAKVDRVQQDKQVLQWRQELYNSINKDFANFILNTKKEFGLSGSTSTGAIFNKSLSSLNWVKRAVSSNESAVKVSTTSEAVNGSYDVTVHRLADGVKAASSANITKDGGNSENLASQFEGLTEGDIIRFRINDKEFSFNGTDKISDVVKQINASDAGVQVSYDASIDRFFIQTTTTGENAVLKVDALYDFNPETGTGTYSDAGQKFIEALKLNVTSYDDNGNLIPEALGIETTYKGVDAKITFNGAENITKSTNQFTINGINLDLRTTGSTTVRVDTDTDAVYDKIKGFVDKYNEIVDKMGKLLGEKQYRDYRPLTAEQKEAMKEKEIELWEEKAKSGLLRNDSIISSTMQNLRNSLYNGVEGIEGPFKALYEIGIDTEKWAAGAIGGKLEIDEEKLRKAISEDVDGVLDLLFKEAGPVPAKDANGNLIPGETVEGKGGVITRMYNTMIEGMKQIVNKAGPGEESSLFRNINSKIMIDFVTNYGSISMLDKDISDIDNRISDLNALLIRKEDKYYNQFAAMEKFVQQMNNQGSWLMQQLGM
ncbi:flagellar filament capping protein FliD [Proteiniborus sp.]|uniref:flagellar filament capping protein FliD n=1 Tax=Proteiniborus sp. TaxID=2079015 RepID=UPI00332E1D8E